VLSFAFVTVRSTTTAALCRYPAPTTPTFELPRILPACLTLSSAHTHDATLRCLRDDRGRWNHSDAAGFAVTPVVHYRLLQDLTCVPTDPHCLLRAACTPTHLPHACQPAQLLGSPAALPALVKTQATGSFNATDSRALFYHLWLWLPQRRATHAFERCFLDHNILSCGCATTLVLVPRAPCRHPTQHRF